MASVKLEHIYKVYPGGVKAVNDMTVDIKDGEFIVIVGPSGCGKSTTLRMIAGLEDITAGELYIGDHIVNDVEPKDRDIAMVFQNYALYPHMTVYENMAFGLKLRHVPNDIIQTKVLWAANILGLTSMLDRKPRAMSGGQRQRVALGRAILRDPKVMLLDEPLSNLDAKLRTQMRTEIANLHQKLKTTFVYVTHDQTEAMTLGDRIVVMKLGRVQQFDTPKNLYDYPSNKFVAGFIGTPQMNFFDGLLTREGDKVRVHLNRADRDLVVPFNDLIKVTPSFLDGKHPVAMGIRCERLALTENKDGGNVLPVKVSHIEELGSEALVYGDINLKNDSFQDKTSQIIIKVPAKPENLKPASVVYVRFDMAHSYFFDSKTEDSIVPLIPQRNVFDAEVKGGKLVFLGQSLTLPRAIAVEDAARCELTIPNYAFTISAKGQFKAKVVKTEKINDIKLLHLEADNRVFFALADKEEPAGREVSLDIDFTSIKVVDEKENEIIKPLPKVVAVHAGCRNYKTVVAKDSNPLFPQAKASREQDAAAAWGEKLSQLRSTYEKTRLPFVKPALAARVKELDARLAPSFSGLAANSLTPAKAAKSVAQAAAAYSAAVLPGKDAIKSLDAELEPLRAEAQAQTAALTKAYQAECKSLAAEYAGKARDLVAAVKTDFAQQRRAEKKAVAEKIAAAGDKREKEEIALAARLYEIDFVAKRDGEILKRLQALKTEQDAKAQALAKTYEAKVAAANAAYDAKQKERDPIGYALRVAKTGAADDLAKIAADRDSELAVIKANHKQNIKEFKANNKHVFFEQKARERIEFREFMRTNKDRDSIKRRKQEHRIFREAYPDQKSNAYDQAEKGEALNFDNAVSKTKSGAKRLTQVIKKRIADFEQESLRQRDPIGYLTKALADDIVAYGRDCRQAIYRAGFLYSL